MVIPAAIEEKDGFFCDEILLLLNVVVLCTDPRLCFSATVTLFGCTDDEAMDDEDEDNRFGMVGVAFEAELLEEEVTTDT